MNYAVIYLNYGINAIVLVTTFMFLINAVFILYLFTKKLNINFLKYFNLFFTRYILLYIIFIFIISLKIILILPILFVPFYLLYREEIINLKNIIRQHIKDIYERKA